MDLLLDELLRQPADPPVRPDGPTVRILSDLWLGGMPLPRAAGAAGLAVADAERVIAELAPRPARRRLSREEGEARLRTLVDEGLSAAAIADQLGMSENSIRRWATRAGVRFPARRTRGAGIADDAVRLYRQGRTIRAVAAELGLHPRHVWRHLDRAGVERRPRGTLGVTLSRGGLERLYVQDGLSIAEVAERFAVTRDVVARNLDRYAIPRRRPPLDRAVLEELYVQQRLGIRAVAARLEVSETKVRADLAHHGIPVRRPGRPARTGTRARRVRPGEVPGSTNQGRRAPPR